MSRLSSALGLAVLLLPSLAAAASHPRCVAFCVGIERFRESERVGDLKYVGEDTFAVWRRLKAVANLDESRSTLIVVDREKHGDLPKGRDLRDELTYTDLIKEFDNFLLRVKSEDLVVVYLQGHGLIKKRAMRAGVHFLTTDFERVGNTFRGGVEVDHFLDRIENELGEMPTVETIFFANMCHAGAAPGAMGADRPTVQELEQALQAGELKLAAKLAYIPACAGAEEVFEKDEFKRSEFAKHLLDALAGAAADRFGAIRSQGIFDYLHDNMSTKPPQHPNFPLEIEIGKTFAQEARMRRFLGWTLAAVALDQKETEGSLPDVVPVNDYDYSSPANGAPANPYDYRRSPLPAALGRNKSVRSHLLQIAEAHFARCREIHAESQASSMLSQMQSRLLQQRDVSDLFELLPADTSPALDGRNQPLRNMVAKLREAAESHEVDQPRPVIAAIRSMNSVNAMEQESAAWDRLWRERPGFASSATFKIGFGEPLEKIVRRARNWVQSNAATGAHDLILVYTGQADESDGELIPVSQKELWEIARSWPADVVIVWDAPFGGWLREGLPQDLQGRVSLLLSASQKNGMTFGRSSRAPGTTGTLLSHIDDGISQDRLQKAYEAIRQSQDDPPSEYVVGKPEYVGKAVHPSLSGSPMIFAKQAADAVGAYGVPDAWWAMRFALKGEIEPQNWIGRPQVGAPDSWSHRLQPREGEDLWEPFSRLQRAAAHEALRQGQEAQAELQALVAALQDPFPESLDQDPNLMALREKFVLKLREIRDHVATRNVLAGPKIHTLLAAASEYRSPLIGDLAGPPADIGAWQRELKTAFGDRVVDYQTEDRSAGKIREQLRKACDACGMHDVVLFVFSGRGFQYGEDRYLATAELDVDKAPVLISSFTDPPDGAKLLASRITAAGATDGAIRVSEIVDAFTACKGVGIAVFDCQFSSPQALHPLQKHLLSLLSPAAALDAQSSARLREGVNSRGTSYGMTESFTHVQDPLIAGSRGIYIWWSGELRENQPRGRFQEAPAVSPLSRSLVASLAASREVTHRDWLRRATRELVDGRSLIVQGALDDPLFTSGSETPPLRLLLSDYHAKSMNLDLALEILAEPLFHSPLDDLTRAAVLGLRAKLHSEAGIEKSGMVFPDLQQARTRVLELSNSSPQLNEIAEAGLMEIYLETGTRIVEAVDGAGDAFKFVVSVSRGRSDEVFENDADRRYLPLVERAIAAEARQFLDRQIKELSQPGSTGTSILLKQLKALRATQETHSDLIPIRSIPAD
jgi:hypothetical protein